MARLVSNTDNELPLDIKMRQINCELNPLSRSDGSALFAQGETLVLASMHGPIEAKMSNLKIDKASVAVTYRPKRLPTLQDKLKEAIIRSTCETAIHTALHPRTTISIQIQEMENRCGIEACAVNAACMALLIGGVPMKFSVAAVNCIIDKDNKITLDPDHRQAIGALANFLFVFDSLQRDVVALYATGRFTKIQYDDARQLCQAASDIIFNFYRKIISKSQNKSLASLELTDETPTDVTMEE